MIVLWDLKKKAAREEQGLSQEELANQTGFHRTYVGVLEYEESSPSLQTVQKLTEALELEESELLSRQS